MKKEDINKTRFCLQYDDHAKVISNILCSMIEHQSLVDLAVRCGNHTIHVHKCVLAANSNYFKEQLEKNADTEQIVINGVDFSVVKALIEFMYCGETNILEENIKYLVATAKFFQMRGLQSIVQDKGQFNIDSIGPIPPPTFLSKKPKYSNTYLPFNNPNVMNSYDRNVLSNDPSYHRRLKRKYMRTEAEKACAKEAAASRLALEALQKELANTSQVSSFVIEESCTETTVENFIPHTEETYMENLGHMANVPLQVVNYSDLNPPVISNPGMMVSSKNSAPFGLPTNEPEVKNPTAEKLKHILGTDNLPSNVEIMFKTSEGNFVTVTEEVLASLSRGSIQYQLVDENGHAGELQEVRVNDKLPIIDHTNNTVEDMVIEENTIPNRTTSEIETKVDQNDSGIFVPVDDNQNDSNKLPQITDEYEGMIRECSSQDFFSDLPIKPISNIEVKKKMNKEPVFSTKQFEVFEEDTNTLYLSNCDPLSEACGIAEKEESDKLKSINHNASENCFIKVTDNLLPTELYENMKNIDAGDSKNPLQKYKLSNTFIDITDDPLKEIKVEDLSPRKARTSKQNAFEVVIDLEKENQCVNKYFETFDKNKKLLNLKKKKII